MNEHCRMTHRSEKEIKNIGNRINRIEGQIRGIKQMVEREAYCDDVLVQISAAANSLKSLGRVVLNNHLKTCVKKEILNGNDLIIDEVINSFSKLQ